MRKVLSPEELKKGELVPPAWYPVEIVRYEEEEASDEAKNPGSTNAIFYFKIIDGPESVKGIELKRLFNETALGFGKNLWKTLQFPYDKVKGYDISTELLKSQIGKKLKVYVKRGKSNKGNEFNDVADFQPLT